SGKLCYFENDEIHEFPYNDKISQVFPKSIGPAKKSFWVDSLDNVYLGLKNFGIITISPEGICRNIENADHAMFQVVMICKEKYMSSTYPLKASNEFLDIEKGKRKCFFQFKKIGFSELYPIQYFSELSPDGKSLYISMEHLLLRLQEDSIVQKCDFVNDAIIWLGFDNEGDLWVSFFNGGIKMFPKGNLNSQATLFLFEDTQVTSIYKDKEGGLWFSTLNAGVFYFPNIMCRIYNKSMGLNDNKIKAVYEKNGFVYVGFDLGFVDVLQKDKIYRHFLPVQRVDKKTIMRYIYGDPVKDKIWVGTFLTLGYFVGNKYHQYMDYKKIRYPQRMISSKDGGYWVGSAYGIYKIKDDKVVYNSQVEGFSAMISSLAEDNNGTLWFSTVNGLWKYSNKIIQYVGQENKLLSKQCGDMFFNRTDSSLWLGTNGAGVVIYHPGRRTVSQLTTDDGLVSNSIQDFFEYNSSVWVGTQKGISVIASKNGKIKDVQNITMFDGLPTNEINSIFIKDSTLYVGMSNGLAITNLKNCHPNTYSPNIVLNGINVDGKDFKVDSEKVNIEYASNLITVSYSGLAYKNMGKLLYRYRLLGLDTNWVYTFNTSCSFSQLNTGSYLFEIQAQNSSNVWSPSRQLVTIIVAPPYWQKWWFILIVASALASILYGVYMLRMREVNKRNELINNINLYKQQSLRQQMNPHFIFNTLNSIQYYILERDTISSHKYLTKFAKLMRLTLDNSQSPTIPLHDEIEALRLYLDLEALRLEGKFTYSIDIDEDESILDIKVPTLLIQPFVENAIWHGIMLKPDKCGTVKISLTDKGSYVECLIRDDGVGREEAKRVRESNTGMHKSRGFQITQQRIDLLSSMYKERFNIKIVDLYDKKGSSEGTLVSITIPKSLT
ncbi:MAG TPA: histidine kinase, partial [Tenuifilaceae bacterium]|nr:histidine kinase [Tenuifilaceae bacterium]